MDIRRQEPIKAKGEDSPVGSRTRVKIVKNKVASPFKEAYFDITFGKGINKMASVTEAGERLGLIKKTGSVFKYDGKSFVGRAKMLEHFEADVDAFKVLDDSIRDQLKLKPVIEATEELEAPEDTLVVEG
jgi:recombination protein RecA